MKYLKTQNLSKFNVQDNTFIVEQPTGQATLTSKSSLKLPIGEKIFRPFVPFEGMVRFTIDDTTAHEISDVPVHYPNRAVGLEVYYEGVWYPIRLQTPARILKENYGVGNYDAVTQPFEELSQYFPAATVDGNHPPMNYVPGLAHGFDPRDYVDNMIVLIENVFQVSGTNFELVETDGEIIGFEILTAGSSDHTSMTVSVSTSDSTGTGGVFTANLESGSLDSITVVDGGSGYNDSNLITVTVSGDGSVNPTVKARVIQPGWHIKFLSAVPDTKPVTVYFGYDQ